MKFARIVAAVAVDVLTEPPEGFFTPEIAAEFIEVPDEVQDGWLLNDGAWLAPATPGPDPKPMPAPTESPKVSPVQFKLLFTATERVAIKTARDNDLVIDDFYDIVEDPRLTFVDLGLQSTKDAIGYLQSKQLLTAERAAEILTGKVL